MKLNPNVTWKRVEERLARESDPIIRRNLELVLAHMQAEAKGDIEGVVETLTEAPGYLAHDLPDVEAMNPKGSKDAVRAFYDLTIIQTDRRGDVYGNGRLRGHRGAEDRSR